ncbi:hypothetical protein MMC14_001095 [Varicellaria rhodocarpa]|nr:hypothetical protein [Varicellaria rhodocarpa]
MTTPQDNERLPNMAKMLLPTPKSGIREDCSKFTKNNRAPSPPFEPPFHVHHPNSPVPTNEIVIGSLPLNSLEHHHSQPLSTEYPFPITISDSNVRQHDDAQAAPATISKRSVWLDRRYSRKVPLDHEQAVTSVEPITQAEISKKRYPSLVGLGADPIAALMKTLVKGSSHGSGSNFIFTMGSRYTSQRNKARRAAFHMDRASRTDNYIRKSVQEMKLAIPNTITLRKASTALSSSSSTVLSQERSHKFEKSAKSSLSAAHDSISGLPERGQSLDLASDNTFSNVNPDDKMSNITQNNPTTGSSIPHLLGTIPRLGVPAESATSISEVHILPNNSTSVRTLHGRSIYENEAIRRLNEDQVREVNSSYEIIWKRDDGPDGLSSSSATETTISLSSSVVSSPIETFNTTPPLRVDTHTNQQIINHLDMTPTSSVPSSQSDTSTSQSDTSTPNKDTPGLRSSPWTDARSSPRYQSTTGFRLDESPSTTFPELHNREYVLISKRSSKVSTPITQEIEWSPILPDRKLLSEVQTTPHEDFDDLGASRGGVSVERKFSSETGSACNPGTDDKFSLDGGSSTSNYKSQVRKQRNPSFPSSSSRYGSAIGISSHKRRPSIKERRQRQLSSPAQETSNSLRTTSETRRISPDDSADLQSLRNESPTSEIYCSTGSFDGSVGTERYRGTSMAGLYDLLSSIREVSSSPKSQPKLDLEDQ